MTEHGQTDSNLITRSHLSCRLQLPPALPMSTEAATSVRGTLAVQKALYRPGTLKRGAFEVLEVRWANPHSPRAAACPMFG